jgi:Tfp pilus assembly protein PilZ
MVGERRRSARYGVKDVRGTLLFIAEARVLEMSLTGMSVETDTRLRLDRTYSLRLHRDDGQEVPLTATVVWCQLRQAKDRAAGGAIVYVAGLRFENVLTEKAQELVAFLQSSAVISVQTRLCGRFKSRFSKAVNLLSDCEFEVKMISASGMLIVADLETEQGSQFDMELQLDGHVLHAQGRVANVRPVSRRGKPALVELGVEFLDMDPEDRDALLDFIGRQIS